MWGFLVELCVMKNKKAIFLLIVVLAIGFGGWFFWQRHEQSKSNSISEYEDLLKQSESVEFTPESSATQQVALTTMLESGIFTLNGVLQSIPESVNGIINRYQIYLNSNPTPINAVSEIELVKAFLINGNQVLLLGFEQGGNQCARQYQFISIGESGFTTSRVFGSCMPISNIVSESDAAIYIATPQNNPYLGNDVNFIYKYDNGEISLYSKPNKAVLKAKYNNLTAAQIIQKATDDGCYQDGVLLDNGACGGGRKYCTMFKNLRKPIIDSNYQLLKDFCN